VSLNLGTSNVWSYDVIATANSPGFNSLSLNLGSTYKVDVFATCTPTQVNQANQWFGDLQAASTLYVDAGVLAIIAAALSLSGVGSLVSGIVAAAGLAAFAAAKILDYSATLVFNQVNSFDPPDDYKIRVPRDYPMFSDPYGTTGNITRDEEINASYQTEQKLDFDKVAIATTLTRINSAAEAGDLYWKTIQEQDYLFFIQRKEVQSSQNETEAHFSPLIPHKMYYISRTYQIKI